MDNKSLIKALAMISTERLMEKNGYAKEDTSHIEWDPNREDSQFSMCYEDAELVVQTVLDAINNSETEVEEESNTTVTTSTAIFIFCDAGYGNPMYVRDVRRWLNAVDKANIPDDAEVEGKLHLDYDIRNNPLIEPIECGECGYQDTLITHHTCKAIEEHKRMEGDT